MSVMEAVEPAASATAELASELVEWARRAAAQEARWLAMLAEFDRRCGFAVDGHRDCVSWLMDTSPVVTTVAAEAGTAQRAANRRANIGRRTNVMTSLRDGQSQQLSRDPRRVQRAQWQLPT